MLAIQKLLQFHFENILYYRIFSQISYGMFLSLRNQDMQFFCHALYHLNVFCCFGKFNIFSVKVLISILRDDSILLLIMTDLRFQPSVAWPDLLHCITK